MDIVERENRVTIEINLECWRSVRDAISYIEKEANIELPDNDFVTSKVRIIKMLRAYGTAIEKGDIESVGLKSAKDFVEGRMDDIKLPTAKVLKAIRDW